MLAGRSWEEWIEQYERSHRHPVNRFCHTIGIPLIAASLVVLLLVPLARWLWPAPLLMFVVGWAFQFIGHWFEGKPPEFFRDWRFLLVGLRWWLAHIRGRA